MFDFMKNLGNLPQLMQQAREAQEKLHTIQEELARKRVTADAGAGMVEATCNGRLELVGLKIDRSRLGTTQDGKTQLAEADVEMLEDLVVAAVAAAQAKAADLARDEMAKAAEGMGLPPGMLPGA
ncbi:MAG: YbaB/EbfC family nucleoid-associated protein [Phycisphaerae bacterium]